MRAATARSGPRGCAEVKGARAARRRGDHAVAEQSEQRCAADRPVRFEPNAAVRTAEPQCCSPSQPVALTAVCCRAESSSALPCHAVGCERPELLRVREAFPLFVFGADRPGGLRWRARPTPQSSGSTPCTRGRGTSGTHLALVAAIWRSSLRCNEDPKPGRPYGAVCIGHCRRARCTCVASRLGQRTREGGRLRTSAFGDTLPRSPETPRRLSAEGTLWYSQNDCAQHPPSAFHGGMACTLLPNGMDHVL